MFVAALLILVMLLGAYLFFTFRKTAEFCFKAKPKRFQCVFAAILSALFLLPLFFMFSGGSMPAVIVLHFAAYSLAASFLNLIISKFYRGRVWELVYKLCLIPIILTAVTVVYGYFNMINVVQTDYTVITGKLEKGSQYKIAVLSDIHYGTTVNKKRLEETASQISSQNVDLVVLCGDITDESTTKEQVYELYEGVGKISSRYGIYYVYGNHDRASYSQNPNFSEEDIKQALSQNNITLLADEVVNITEDFVLAGRKDRSMKPKNIDELLAGVDKSSFVFVADHQPTGFEKKEKAGVDLQISGHTHGGQIFPIGYINEYISTNELCYGKRNIGSMTAIVTSGVSGWGFPIRTQPHSEYVIITVLGK